MIKLILSVCIAGCILYVVTELTGHGIPCVFHLITGLQCPGCGMTRAVISIAHGDIGQAFEYNALSVTLVPVVIIYLCYRGIRYIRDGREEFRAWEIVFLLTGLIIAIGYGIIRNR